jgi:hypothetical protein
MIKADMLTPKDQRLEWFWANHSARAGSDQPLAKSACQQLNPPATITLRMRIQFGGEKAWTLAALHIYLKEPSENLDPHFFVSGREK